MRALQQDSSWEMVDIDRRRAVCQRIRLLPRLQRSPHDIRVAGVALPKCLLGQVATSVPTTFMPSLIRTLLRE